MDTMAPDKATPDKATPDKADRKAAKVERKTVPQATVVDDKTASDKTASDKTAARRNAAGVEPTATGHAPIQGRAAAIAVRAYLDHLKAPRRRTRTKAQLTERIEALTGLLETGTDSLDRLRLIQQRVDLIAELSRAPEVSAEEAENALEAAFAAAAGAYSEQHRISYSAWREFGVPASLLARTNVARTRTNR